MRIDSKFCCFRESSEVNKVQTVERTVYKICSMPSKNLGDVDEVDFVCQVLTLLDGKNDDLILGLNRILLPGTNRRQW